MIQEYSLGIQTQITPSMDLEVGYSGARGLHLFDERSINQAGLASPCGSNQRPNHEHPR